MAANTTQSLLKDSTQEADIGLGIKDLHQRPNEVLLRQLAAAVDGEAAAATFACGGSVQISPSATTAADGHNDDDTRARLQLRWDTQDGSGGKIHFPLLQDDDMMLKRLVETCQPASFGLSSMEVLDESYRKASKLDRSEFLTDFHPHDCGIIDSIRQILLPSMSKDGEGIGIGTRGVRAELYKLNIYSGPSGMFNAHVDTQRGATNFGSLVVCLPYNHTGGTLVVWHKGKVVEFDWSQRDDSRVQWAAFYGDCQHQVLEVTSGHRITLTYNLYYSDVGNLAQPVADPKKLALYSIIREMYEQPGFMTKGAMLGLFCNHQYAHSQSSGCLSLPGSLKGVDLAVFAAFKALGLKVMIRPVMEKDGWYGKSWGGLRVRHNGNEGKRGEEPKDGTKARPKPTPKFDGEYGKKRNTLYMEDVSGSEGMSDSEEVVSKGTVVGTKLHGPMFGDMEGDFDDELAPHAWPHKVYQNIHWLNDPIH